ncbi:HIT family protein [Salinicoccus hispanicus]|uniref:HIT domain-containing protein n=1 Tax=Salinicoccus hispanicus TaxID=157225 RepID=A0A6N8U315_9STAP|nr:HIT family protein [Salinicoccus hispanicus]MXQ50571.1 HIT domain-containing protein [Salinicoccus hispanicus]
MSKTIFEQIAAGEIPANIVYEDEVCIAFTDAFPLSKGHTLVVPRQPVENIYDLDEETGAHLMKVITKVANAIRSAFSPDGLNVVQNNGSYASQSVFHIHFHLIPRYKEEYDGFGYQWEQDPNKRTDEEKSEIENTIRTHLNA